MVHEVAEESGGTDPDVAIIIAFLTALRQELGISQTELAERTKTSQPWISEMESGSIFNPRADSIAKVARALGVTLSLQVSVRGDAANRQHARVALNVARDLRARGIDVVLARVT